MMKGIVTTLIVSALVLLVTPTAGAEGWKCDAAAGIECTATLILADGTTVPVALERGQELHRGEGVTVMLTSDNWDPIPQ